MKMKAGKKIMVKKQLSEAMVVSKRVGLDLTGKLVTIRPTDWSGSGHKIRSQIR